MPLERPGLNILHERGTRDGSSFRETFGPDESSATAKFFVEWDQRHDAVEYFLGNAALARDGSDNITHLNRLLPIRHPDIFYLRATKIPSITGHGPGVHRTSSEIPGAKLNTFEKAEVEVYWEHVAYDVLEDNDLSDQYAEYERFTSFGQLKPSAEYVMLPGGTLKYTRETGTDTPHGGAIQFNVGKILPVMDMELVWHMIPFDIFDINDPSPWFERIFGDGTNRPYLGTVNKTDFFGFKAGTILFSNVELRQRRHPTLGVSWDIVFTLAFDPNKWNFKYFWPTSDPPTGAGWYLITTDQTYYAAGSIPDDKTIYAERDLHLLWKVAA